MVTRRRRVIWARAARQALDEALAYVAQDSAQAAGRLARRVIEAGETLATLSERGRPAPEVDDPILRELRVAPYWLVYEVHEAEVHVVAFVHERQDFQAWQRGSS